MRGDPEAQLGIANMLIHGQGVAQDFSRARYWCTEADKAGYAQGGYCLGYLYQHGLGLPTDAKKARKLYEDAANRNDAFAVRALAQMDEAGEGGKVDLVGAFVWYAELAGQKDTDALQQLIRLKNKMSANDWQKTEKQLQRHHFDTQKVLAAMQASAAH